MHAPKGANAAGRGALREAEAILRRLAEDPANCAPTLRRYALVVTELDVATERWEAEGRPMTMPGSRSALTTHAALDVIAKLRRQVDALEEALGLTPQARASLARKQGGRGVEHAPDRRRAPRRGPAAAGSCP